MVHSVSGIITFVCKICVTVFFGVTMSYHGVTKPVY